MSKKFKEYNQLDLSQINKEILKEWDKQDLFTQSMAAREGNPSFVFFEGPPSANGLPGIHHVMARSIKDIFCRYKTMKGFQVKRKAGWDTHGLPVELGVEKALGITKVDIGDKVSVDDYNAACRKEVMKYTAEWEDLTHKMGYWVDMKDPYITYDNRYMETLWWLLKQLYKKGLIYKGYTIQPYSPAAGTGLSSHELNQPGCYRDVKDTTCVAQFKIKEAKPEMAEWGTPFFIAWTTTPWTLPSNTALCVGPKIEYVAIQTFNSYSANPITLVLAKKLLSTYFKPEGADAEMAFTKGDKIVPYRIVGEYVGKDLEGMEYEQLVPWINPGKGAFKVILGDFVTTEDGTGIVHIAPTFGADDATVAKKSGIPGLQLISKKGETRPMVDLQGKFYLIDELDADFVTKYVDVEKYNEFAGRFVKNDYDPTLTEKDETLDVSICMMLKKNDQVFKIEKHVHSYPHCWRTDKPVLYYPLDSWFIKSTACKDRMIALNKTIKWKPESTGTGRFGKWLENLNDWNLSRSRYWGTPIPIWRNDDGEELCIGSIAELSAEIDKSVAAGIMTSNPYTEKGFVVGDYDKDNYEKIDLHRPYVDDIILVSPSGKPMKRELDLIDVWFDSGAMPYAQMHYPFENKDKMESGKVFPADFIAEGVDQTRGWFFTLHAIATMVFDTKAYKAVISNGLVLDTKGNKMSKRLGNAVDPFSTIEKYGSDPVRWYMITNAQPWDNLKFDINGIDEVRRKFFATLYNTYSFFSLYANVDNFDYSQNEVPVSERPKIDQWVLSLLNSLVKNVDACFDEFEPTRAGRLISDFVSDNLSNWYVRLNRKRFWGGGFTQDKLSAFQTLYRCMEVIAKLMAPIAPFYADRLFRDLTAVTGREEEKSVHLALFPVADESLIDPELEASMKLAQDITSMTLALRRKVSIKVRQPLECIMIPVVDERQKSRIQAVESLIKNELNIKEIRYVGGDNGILVKKVKCDFKKLGPKFGKQMKEVAGLIHKLDQERIAELEHNGKIVLILSDGAEKEVIASDLDIFSEDIPGWLVSNEGRLTVALDIMLTPELKKEGIARELVNRIQNLRKSSGLEITDKIQVYLEENENITEAIAQYKDYIATQVLAEKLELVSTLHDDTTELDMDGYTLQILVERVASIDD